MGDLCRPDDGHVGGVGEWVTYGFNQLVRSTSTAMEAAAALQGGANQELVGVFLWNAYLCRFAAAGDLKGLIRSVKFYQS